MTFTVDAKRLSGVSSGVDKFLVSSKPWGYDPDFGIVHPCGCAICRNYMLHVSEGDVDSYALAIMERDAEYRNRFLDGFRKGRAAQLEHDTERLSSYRSERNLAREQVAVYEIKVQEVEKEVLRLKDELLALRIAYNEVSLINGSTSFSEVGCDRDGFIFDTDDGGEYEGLSDEISEGEATAVENDVVEDVGVTEVPPGHPGAESPNRLPSFSPPAVGEVLDVEREITHQSPLQPIPKTDEIPPSHPTPPLLGSPPAISAAPIISAVDEIRKKMKLAHLPNRGEILAEVKDLISKAHKTPRSQRTEVQKVLITEWRSPPLSVIYPFESFTAPSVAPAPPEPEEINVYVDASGIGIGFYLLGRWQAWKLKEGWMSAKGGDIQWAEAVAVEMGVRLLLKAGYAETKIRLHSDNQQVVDAISTRDINRTRVGPIVQLYDNLCCSYSFDCSIKWIPGAENPADGPSRFLLLDRNKRFPCDVTIPPHLQEFVLPYHFSE